MLLFVAAAAQFAGQPAPARGADAPKQWAVLIGVQEHVNPMFNLKYSRNDVASLRETLQQRAGLPAGQILQLTDDVKDGQPTLMHLREKVLPFLAQVGKDDRMLVFFSGHGYLHKDQTYLVPSDFNLDDPSGTGLPVAALRKALIACPAKVKFLILDCCHAGSAKDLAPGSLAAEAVAKAVEEDQPVSGCVVLASCRKEERSYEWAQREHGVFTYWLCRALEGAAANDKGQVGIADVDHYVSERVSQTAEQLFKEKQHPVRLDQGPVAEVPTVLALRPEPPESLCRRLAEHMDLEVRRKNLKKVGVLEFLLQGQGGEGLAPANLPGYCAEQVRQGLQSLAGEEYKVMGAQEMRQAAKDLVVEGVGQPGAMQRLGQQGDHLDAVVTGTLKRRGATKLQLQCDLVATEDGSSLVSPSGLLVSGVLPLSEDELGDTPHTNFDLREGRPEGGPYAPTVVQFAQQQSYKQHPLLKKKGFPFPLELWSIHPRRGEEIGPNTRREPMEFVQVPVEEGSPGEEKQRMDLVVPAREGQVFEIRVANKSEDKVAMVLLVDGYNTLEQQCDRLGRGRAWVLDPGEDYVIPGWTFPRRGETARIKRFKFVDVAASVAGRHKYGESIGLITAAFYGPRGRAVAVGEGPEEERPLETSDFKAGRLLRVVQIRYADAKDLK
jgi:uncharacterized caspase-like protein